MKLKLVPVENDVDTKSEGLGLGLPQIARQGQVLDNIRLQLEKQTNDSFHRIAHYQIGYEAQVKQLQFKWNKLSANQQSLSNLMKQLKNVQSIWKLQLDINLQINKLSKLFGFYNNQNIIKKPSNEMFGLCVKIIHNIHNMTQQSNNCIIQLQIAQKNKSKSSLNDIVIQLHHEIKLYSNIMAEIIKFAFNSIVKMDNLYIFINIESIQFNHLKELFSLLCIDKMDIAFIHCLLCSNIFDILFDSSLSDSLFAISIKSSTKNSLEISRKFVNKKEKNVEIKNLLHSNVKMLMQIIEWLAMNIFANNKIVCKHWKENYLFPSMDEWIISWINLNAPIAVLSALISVPKFEFADDEKQEIQIESISIKHSAIQHIHCSIAYQENIENALRSLQQIMDAIYLKQSLQLLIKSNPTQNKYGLSSKILSQILPGKIRQYIYENIRNKIKNHDYESFNPIVLHNHIHKMDDNNNKIIKYSDMILLSELFFRKQPCKISVTIFEIIIIIYNICIFIEQMYYIVDESDLNIICLSTMYVDLFMDICCDIIQLWMSLSISYHNKYFTQISYIGLQFYNDSAFLSFHLSQLSIKTNHGNVLITDNFRQMMQEKQICKFIWFAQYIQPLKSLGKQYFILHLHNQRQTILQCLSRFIEIFDDDRRRFEALKQSFSESLISISQFLNGCRSIIPDNLLYQIGGKLLECVCNQIVSHVIDRIDNPETCDISMEAARAISKIIRYVKSFEVLSNDLEYMTRNMQIWKMFIKLGDILAEDINLSILTNQLNQGELDIFDKQTLIKLVCALWQDSEKRTAVIQDIELMLADSDNFND